MVYHGNLHRVLGVGTLYEAPESMSQLRLEASSWRATYSELECSIFGVLGTTKSRGGTRDVDSGGVES